MQGLTLQGPTVTWLDRVCSRSFSKAEHVTQTLDSRLVQHLTISLWKWGLCEACLVPLHSLLLQL